MLYRKEVGIRDYWHHPQAHFKEDNKGQQGVWVNDLGLIKLDRMIPAEEFIPICLPDENTNYDDGTQLSVYGTDQIQLLHIHMGQILQDGKKSACNVGNLPALQESPSPNSWYRYLLLLVYWYIGKFKKIRPLLL